MDTYEQAGPSAGEPQDPGEPVVMGAEFKADAHRRYAWLRARGPIHRAQFFPGITGWVVVGYDLARQALTHPALLKDPEPAAAMLEAAGFLGHKRGTGLGGQMLEADPPEHTRLRSLVSGVFSRRRSAAMEPRITEIADGLIDALPPSGELDLVEAFTAPLPVAVIAELLGIPHADRQDFRRWTSLAFQVGHPEYAHAVASLHGFLRQLAEDKRREPGDDLLSALVAARDTDDGRLSQDELAGTAALLVIAGHETTVNLLGNAVLALLQHPDQLRLLRENPALLPDAVEEFLRYDTSVERTTNRYAARGLELGGVHIPRGGIVAVALASAGRDAPLPGGGDPDTLDITRPAARHLAFGHGIHHCLGAPLARLEARVALHTLLTRVPHLELAVPADTLDWFPAGMVRGVLSLPVRYRRE
ncbi:cytochrome P450 family protein [Streptomyces sp. YU58]|uniref:cytochrome P450 family protein n=1 Tax=Streptomyces sp. SX92 TaxID=3158972 RepID=UPI0027B94701|nr:cytochrome P450 [Streptomyces coralus]WLW57293.1 cytochrome P450 [Streptomyces coralus]